MKVPRSAEGRRAGWLPYLAIAGAIALLTIALTVTELLREAERQDERALARTESAAHLLNHQLQGVFSKIDLSLSTLAVQYNDERSGGRAEGSRLDRLLISQKALLPEVEYLRITDAQGMLRASSQPLPSAPVSVGDLALFTRTRDAGDRELVVTGPFVGRISRKWVVTFSRRLVDADGRFAGVVYASVSSDYFARVFPEARIGPSGVVALRLADTTLFYRHPESPDQEDQVGKPSPKFAGGWAGRT